MYVRILKSKELSLKKKIKNCLKYFLIVRGAKLAWRGTFNAYYRVFPEFKNKIDVGVEKNHRAYWKSFRKRCNPSTLRISKHISGVADHRYIPAEIFMADIEPTLNNTPAVEYLTYKSFYNHWYGSNIFPKDYIHNIDGQWFNAELKPISFNEVKTIAEKLEYPVVCKPNRDSYGGRNVYFPENYTELLALIQDKRNVFVQEKMIQHPFFNQFNPCGINSIRVNMYKSVKDNQLHIVNTVMRMGVGGSLDNVTDGGIVALVTKEGIMGGYAVDKYGTKFYNHPDTGLSLDQKLPDFNGLKELSYKIASKVHYARIICLDVCYDQFSNWRMIEVNINGTTIKCAQDYGDVFFDGFIDEVKTYCIKHHWALS